MSTPRGEFLLTDPDSAEATMTLTMTLREWKELRQQLTTDYPAWRFGEAICSLVQHAHAKFHEQVEIKS